MKSWVLPILASTALSIIATLLINWALGGGFKMVYKDKVLIQWGQK